MTKDRRQESCRIREEAAELARNRVHPIHEANGDEQRYADEHYLMSFTKGLKHDKDTGLVENPAHFEAFRKAINEGFIDAFTENVPVPTLPPPAKRRQWEAPTAGFVFDLEGPDAQAVTMPPAPELGSKELTFEMAEVYELALVRDVPFENFTTDTANTELKESIERLNELYKDYKSDLKRPRIDETINGRDEITSQTAFRGSSPGVGVGFYLSQFLLIGTQSDRFPNIKPSDGKIVYGAQQIDQRVAKAEEVDFMTVWDKWLDVQNGEDTSGDQIFEDEQRFIATPRDLTTYVHFDALYQAYLNACLILLGMEAPFDPDFGALSGSSNYEHFDHSIRRNANGFALFGGPHILTLVTEVATRALKAVRYQKFNNHLRLRPEALAARLHITDKISEEHLLSYAEKSFGEMLSDIDGTVQAIKGKNANNSVLLPMAFPEGSPMHPSYGAGHAVVAGACVTILKAFFDTSATFVNDGEVDGIFKRRGPGDTPIAYTPAPNGNSLISNPQETEPLTLEGELNKLAANISIGRNMAGVHFFSDYYDSLRMGEEIAIGLLEEQALTYPKDDFVFSVPTFDGQARRIGVK